MNGGPIATAVFFICLFFVFGWIIPAAVTCHGFDYPCFDNAMGFPTK